MVNIGADHVNKLLSMSRAIAANGAGLNAAAYGAPYPGSQTTLNVQPPAKQSSMPWIAGMLLGVTGLGVGGGTLWALKDKIGIASPLPAITTQAIPQSFEIKVGFDPDKGGLQVGPAIPAKEKP